MDFRRTPEFSEVTSFLEQSRGLPPGLLSALVGVESTGNPNAVSPAGARGLTQFMPETAKQYNVDVNDPLDSLRGTADYMQDLIHKYDGNVKAALSHYNGGGYNAQFQVTGKAPDVSKVSPQNFAVNQKYVSDIMSKLPQEAPSDYVGKVNAYVTDLAKSGASPDLIINQLMQEPATADLVSQGLKAGDSPEQIVANLGGAAYAPIAAARAKVDAQSFGTNLVQGGAQTIGDAAMAAKQVGARIGGNDQRLAQLQAEQRAAEADPTRQALSETAGAKVADFGLRAAPYAAAAVATGGASIPVMAATQAAAGAAEGLLTPTTEDGQFTRNVLGKALLGGGTAGAAGLVGKGSSALAGRLLAPDAEAASKLALADRMGLTPTASMVSKRMAAVTDAIPAARAIVDDLASKDLTRQLFKGIGQEGQWQDAPALIQQAQKSIYADADTLVGQVVVPRSTAGIGTALKDAVSEYEKNTLKAYRSGEVADVAAEVLNRIKTGNMTGAGLVEARKNILANAFQTDGTTRQALKKIASAIDNHIETIAPNASAALKKANQRWANLQVIENVFKRTNGQPLTPAQLATSVKVTGRDLFETGRAPYQELTDAALKLYGKDSAKSLSGVLRRTVGTGDGMLGAASVLEPTVGVPTFLAKKVAEKLLTKRATSTDRALIDKIANASSSNAPSRHYIAKALGSGTALNYDE